MTHKNILLTIICLALACNLAYAQNDSTAGDFDAFEYRLQKRPARPGFERGRFMDHTFLSASVGASMLITNGLVHADRFSTYGKMMQLHFGKWFSPISGFRVGVSAGINRDAGTRRFAYGGASLDYLLNLSALASGYDYDRLFELVGVAGLDYMAVRRVGANQWGGHLGLQMKFHVSPLVDIWLEPRYAILSDLVDGSESWRGYAAQMSLSLGVAYNMVPETKRGPRRMFGDRFLDGTFLTFGYGGMTLVSGINDPSGILRSTRSVVSAGFGKWFNPMSALRLQGFAGYAKARSGYLKTFGARLDYLFNFNSAFGGYGPARRFELMFVAGIDLALRSEAGEKKILPGVGVGLQGDLQLTGCNSLYIEPRVDVYGKDLSPSMTTVGGIDAIASLNIGFNFMRLTSSEFAKRGQRTFKPFGEHLFVSLGGGVQSLLQRNPRGGVSELVSPLASVAVGKWFTSVSGLRLSGGLGYLKDARTARGYAPEAVRSYTVALAADYMFNFTSALYGYDADRVFELSGLAGLVAVGKSNGQSKFNVGLSLGLQGLFNIGEHWGIYLEPSIKMFRQSFTYGTGVLPEMDSYAALTAGVNYRFTGMDGSARSEYASARKNFVSYSAGAGMVLNGMSVSNPGSHTGFTTRLNYGRHFTSVSALRVAMAFDNVPLSQKQGYKYAGASVEYLFDMTSLANGHDESRIFTLSAFAGPTFGVVASSGKSAFVPGVTGGLQFAFRLNSLLDLTLEPRATLHSKHIYVHSINANPALKLGVEAGLAYKF